MKQQPNTSRGRKLRPRYLLILPALVGFWLLGDGLYIQTKAVAAQVLLERAWERSMRTGEPAKAWSWADTWPVARLRVEHLGIDFVVLEGVSGEALAFGPGRMAGLGPEYGSSTTLIAGHKDTHFRFLPKLRIGDEITLETLRGRNERYRVIGQEIIDYRAANLEDDPLHPKLILVTCYPFEALTVNGPLRYVVIAEKLFDPGSDAES
ncbi:MAG: class GN sortase [Proteobacteria bacterium]|nr:class GN sortase [Pseudomonadota bacterium]